MAHADVNGTRTWYRQVGSGEPVLLLHGGLTDSRDFDDNLTQLADQFQLLLPDRRGHGRTADAGDSLRLNLLAADAAAFVDEVIHSPVAVVGYSAGAMVALRLAVQRPDLIRKLVLISGAFDSDGAQVKPSLDGPVPEPLARAYGEVSPDGIDHFPTIVRKVVDAAENVVPLTPAELGSVTCPTLVVASDDDIISLEHTVEMYRMLGAAQLAIVPGTSHLLLLEKPHACVRIVRDFLLDPTVATMMPLRRSAQDRDGRE